MRFFGAQLAFRFHFERMHLIMLFNATLEISACNICGLPYPQLKKTHPSTNRHLACYVCTDEDASAQQTFRSFFMAKCSLQPEASAVMSCAEQFSNTHKRLTMLLHSCDVKYSFNLIAAIRTKKKLSKTMFANAFEHQMRLVAVHQLFG